MGWEPILEGALGERAIRVVREIADGMAPRPQPSPDLALFWTYVSTVLDDELTTYRSDVVLEQFAADLVAGYSGIELQGGLTGAAWVAAHVSEGVEDFLEAYDQQLIALLSTDRWQGRYDLISGLCGIAVYFLERGDAECAPIGLHRIVEHFTALAERSDAGTTWHTPPALLSAPTRAKYPDGHYDCGIAHGVPGVIAVLTRIAARVGIAEAASLRADAVRWLLAHRTDHGFPYSVSAAAPVPARRAWCYGDPGITIALWDAVPDRELAVMIRRWAEQSDTGVLDACLCHGSAGLAHICNRFYQATREPFYRDAAIAWFERTLTGQRPGEEIAGFPMVVAGKQVAEPRILDGVAGVGLALLAAVSTVEPLWDRLLLCDLPVL